MAFLYSNPGFILLELLIEDITGTTFADYMQESILLPLDMRNSTFRFDNVVNAGITSTHLLNGDIVLIKKKPFRPTAVYTQLWKTLHDLSQQTLWVREEAHINNINRIGREPGHTC